MHDDSAHLSDLMKAWPQYLLPQHALSRLVHYVTRSENRGFKRWLIHAFARRFHIDMSAAVNPDLDAYSSFNAFFTRALREDARPLADAGAICPVDGSVSQRGDIHAGRIFQAKGRSFSTLELLGGDAELAGRFEDGSFTTLYLSPRDYHRIHMPLDGRLRSMVHIPGRLFSVNPAATRAIPRLFARNERVAAIFDTAAGPMALILVGALFVASIETVWAGEVTPPRARRVLRRDYPDADADAVTLVRGAEMGRFNMGSTVIVLFARDAAEWAAEIEPGAPVRMGQALANLR